VICVGVLESTTESIIKSVILHLAKSINKKAESKSKKASSGVQSSKACQSLAKASIAQALDLDTPKAHGRKNNPG
jgi:hypothetical protein